MAKNNHIINSFVAGEVADKFWGRTDTQQYNQSCEELFNMLVWPQGGASKRPGTRYIKEIVKANGDPVTNVGIIPFQGSDGTRWNICFTPEPPDIPPGYVANQPLEWMAISEATANGVDVAYVGLDTAGGADAVYSGYYNNYGGPGMQYAQAGDTLIVVRNRRPMRIIYTPLAPTNLKFTLIPMPNPGAWLTSALTSVTIPSANKVWREMPYLNSIVNVPAEALRLAKGTDTLYTITPSPGSGITFTPSWVGKQFKFTRGVAATVILITGFTSSSTLRGIPIGGTNMANSTNFDFGGANLDYYYEEGAWSDHRGWPLTVTFFESRLVFGGTLTMPDQVWFSQVDDILEFDQIGLVTDPTYTDPIVTSDAFAINLRSNLLNSIKWMSPKKTITIGTNYEEFIAQGPSPTKTIGIDNVQSYGETATGSAYAMAVRVEAATIFLDRTRRVLRELAYNFDENSLRATNLNILAPHMGLKSQLIGADLAPEYLGYRSEGMFKQIVCQTLPLGIVWARDAHGCLAGMTREREQNVIAWHYHQIAGKTLKRPFVQDLSVYPAGTDRFSVVGGPIEVTETDELWMAVTRTVGGDSGLGTVEYTERTYLERMERDWEGATYEDHWIAEPTAFLNAIAGSAPVYMDCTTGYESATYPTGVIPLAALPQGALAEVTVLLNGVHLGKKTITLDGLDLSADITDMDLDGEDWVAMVGFTYMSRVVPLTPEVQAQTGSSQGIPRRVSQLILKFVRTVGAKISRRSNQNEEQTPVDPPEELVFKEGVNQNDPIPLFTGDHKMDFPNGYETSPRVVVESELPFPMHLNALVAQMVAYEK